MSLSFLAPLVYLLIGLGLGRSTFDIKGPASAFLTRFIIPLVIIFNIATHKPGVFVIMLATVVMMCIMLLISRLKSNDPVANLCFSYWNIGWLGMPVASSLFGDGAAMVFIASYVGSSLFGNSIGTSMMAHGGSLARRLIQTLKAPPVWSLLLGVLALPLGPFMEQHGHGVYEVLKFLMSFLGMAILGIWLAGSRPRQDDFRRELMPFVLRAVIMTVLITVLIYVGRYFDIHLIVDNQAALYLMPLLPPAANIIVLETHYLKTGRSASMIACGTCISLVAIGLYALVVTMLR